MFLRSIFTEMQVLNVIFNMIGLNTLVMNSIS